MNKPLRVAVETFGCRSNFADSTDIQASLAAAGDTPCSPDAEGVDVYVVNTCTVTDSADQSVFKAVRRAKKRNPSARVVVTGCLAEVGGARLEGMADAVVGPGRRGELLRAIRGEALEESEPSAGLPSVYPNGKRAKRSAPRFRSLSLTQEMSPSMPGPGSYLGDFRVRSRFHLRVQEGCENSCTFCIIPRTRGRYVSRDLKAVLDDLRKLFKLGYREVVLSGTHLGAYGLDRGESLEQLLGRISEEIDPQLRVRLSSIDPEEVSESLIDRVAKSPAFCKHLHICIQAFNARILKLMNRKHSLEEGLERIQYAAQQGISVGSDVICGFPTESRAEFDEALELFCQAPLCYLHVFPYSEREDTAATRLSGAVELAERKRRASRLRAEAARKKRAWLEGLVGKELDLILETTEGELMTATSGEYAPVFVSGMEGQPGERISALATQYLPEEERLQCVP